MPAADHSRIVDQQADRAERAAYHSGAFAHRGERRQIAVNDINRRSRYLPGDLVTHRFSGSNVTAQHDDRSSGPGKLTARHTSDAVSGSGDNGDFIHGSARELEQRLAHADDTPLAGAA